MRHYMGERYARVRQVCLGISMLWVFVLIYTLLDLEICVTCIVLCCTLGKVNPLRIE